MTERRKPIKMFKTAEESFAYRTEQREDCLVWVGGLDSSGYGLIWDEERKKKAHRYAWTSVGTATPQKPTSRHTTPKHSPILVGAYFYAQNLGERRRSRGGGLTAPTCVIHETD